MKRLAALLALVACAASAQQDGDFGVGLILAEPTGVSAKLWLDEDEAIDAAAAWSLDGKDRFQIHADYLVHRYDLIEADPEQGRAPVYFGIGARFKAGDEDEKDEDEEDDSLGVRLPLGIAFQFAQAPFDVFAEVAPVLDLVPGTDLDISAAVGGRYWFGRSEQLLPRDEDPAETPAD